MSNQTNKKQPIYRGAEKLVAKLRSIWLYVWYSNLSKLLTSYQESLVLDRNRLNNK